MATGAKRGGDMVLGGRHLAGMFIVLVVLFGVVFTLGYVMGRNHGETQLSAAAAPITPAADPPLEVPVNSGKDKSPASTAKTAEKPLPPPSTDWDFYHSAEPAAPSERLVPKPKPVSVQKESPA